MGGDLESLFYNLVQWLGARLPWEKNLENPSLVKQQKNDAFANVEQFLRECFEKTKIPGPIRNFMDYIANMDYWPQGKRNYSNLKLVLRNGLTRLCHVPAGNLLFSLDNVSDDEQTVEGSSEVEQNESERVTRSSLGASVDLLAKIISNNSKGENELNLQGKVVPGSVIHAIYQITRMNRSQRQQDKLASAWENDLMGLKTKTKRLWALKAERKAASNTASTEKKPEESSSQVSSAAAVVSAQTNDGLNHRNPGSSLSLSYFGVMSSNEMPPQEDLALLDPPNFFSPNVRQTLQNAHSASPSRSNPVRSPLFRTSSSGYSSRCSSRVGFHPEDFPLFRTPDPFLEKELCQLSNEVAGESTGEADSNVETVAERSRSESVGFESWHDNYELLNTWLDMKEKDLRAFGSIPSEPRMVISLVRQVRLLLDDFGTQNPRIRLLTNVLAKLPPDSADARKLNRIQQRWRDQSNWLKIRGRELGVASLGQLRDDLQDVSSNLDKLLDEDPEEQQLCKVETLAGQLKGQRAVLASAGTVTEQLCQAFSDPAFNADLRTELRSVNNFYDDLQHRINVKKAETERSLSDGRQFDDSCKKIIVWLAKELDMSEKLIVSADPEKLQQQQQHYKRVMGKEAEVNELLKNSRDFLSRPQNRKNVTQESLHDLMKSQWNCLRKDSLQISNRLQICTEHQSNYSQAQKLLVAWLSEFEHKLGSLQPATLDDVEEALMGLSSLRTEIREKLEEFKQCTNLGDTFVNVCDEDKDLVENELIAMKDMWEKLNNNLRGRTQFLKDTADRFNVFNKCLNELERRVDELKSRDTLREEAGDPNLIDYIKELREDADSLRGPPLEYVRQLADELASKVGDQRLDTSRLLNVVDRVAADIESFRTKLIESLNKAYEQKFASIENDIKPTINNVQEQDVKPRILLSTTNQLFEEIIDLVSDSEGEADFAIDEKPKLLLFNTSPLSKGSIDLVSNSGSEADLVTQQQEKLEPRSRSHQNQLEEVSKNDEQSSKADNLEQKSKEKSSKEKQDVNSVSSSSVNHKSENSKKKRKNYLCIVSDSDNSDSNYDEKKLKSKNSRKERE